MIFAWTLLFENKKTINIISLKPSTSYTIELTLEDENDNKSEIIYINIITADEDKTTSLINQKIKFDVYPNPVNDQLQIATESSETFVYTISSIAGVEISNGTFNEKVSINLSEISQGLYLLKVTNTKGDLIKVEKLIKN